MRDKGIKIAKEEEDYILKAKCQVASSQGVDWVKKNSNFDNSMGALDSCELCECVGLFLLAKTQESVDKGQIALVSIALYRDDLILVTRKHGKIINEVKSKLTKIFKSEDLILCEWTEGTEQNYLDIDFDLNENTYKPYKKEQDNSKYVAAHSDHPKAVLKSIPSIVESRIRMLCSNETIFSGKKREYEVSLCDQGHKGVNFSYKVPETREERKLKEIRKRRNKAKARDVLWFVPPFTKQVDGRTSVGKAFFKILDNCFPKEHSLYKITNRNYIRLSYRTSPNFGRILKGLNRKVIDDYTRMKQENVDKTTRESKKGRGRPKYLVKKDST